MELRGRGAGLVAPPEARRFGGAGPRAGRRPSTDPTIRDTPWGASMRRMQGAFWLIFAIDSGLLGCSGCASTDCVDTATCPGDEVGGAGGSEGVDEGVAVGSGGGGEDVEAGVGGAEGLGGTGALGGGGAEGGTGDAGADEVDAATCDYDAAPQTTPCVLARGVFVSPEGSDANDGSQVHPYKTFAKAIGAAVAAGKPLYACTQVTDGGSGARADGGAAGDFAEAMAIGAAADGVRVYGGFDCDGWQYRGDTPTRVATGVGEVPLSISNAVVGVTIEDFEFDAADAATGGSSIGAIVNGAQNVVLRRVKVFAGKGGDGKPGVDGAPGADGPMFGTHQLGQDATCSAITNQPGGAWTGESGCGSRGGPGGDGKQGVNGSPGSSGVPQQNINQENNDNSGDRGGNDGRSGSIGNGGGVGAASSLPGGFSGLGYVSAPPGGDGEGDGFPGQGGGGGGASNAPSGQCWGASGGAGGMGGCGGKPGTGGASGGASVALLIWNSAVTLDACTLLSSRGGAGGKGGNGGPGGVGQDGAAGGAGYSDDAGVSIGHGGKGGKGGDGGPGGAGAGGNGGPSYAVVYKGTVPAMTGGTTATQGLGGAKGPGGTSGSTQAPDGQAGDSAATYAAP